MSDYSVTTDFSVKDGLTTGDAEKIILGADFDVEFDAIAVAVATKYDSGDLASQAQAEAETSNVVLMTPLRTANWADANGGMVGDIQALADPGADQLLGWDNSASAAIGFTMGTGLAFSTTTIKLSHLGLEDLTDPGADRLFFWDESANAAKFGTLGSGLSFTATTLNVDHDATDNFVANEHINHANVTFSAGDGLSGGGTLAANRSFAVDSTVVRTTGAQTIAGVKTLSSLPVFSGEGQFIHHASSQSGASVTVSTGAPSGGANGDIWFRYS